MNSFSRPMKLTSEITTTLPSDLRDKIIKQATLSLSLIASIYSMQVEYYFSDENLSTDKFLMKYLTKDEEGFAPNMQGHELCRGLKVFIRSCGVPCQGVVPVGVIASFKKVKRLTKDTVLVVAALGEYSLLLQVVSLDGKKVKRFYPLPFIEVGDPELCIVLTENLAEDHSVDNIQHIFGEAGSIKKICIRDPHAVREPRKLPIAERLLSGKYGLNEDILLNAF